LKSGDIKESGNSGKRLSGKYNTHEKMKISNSYFQVPILHYSERQNKIVIPISFQTSKLASEPETLFLKYETGSLLKTRRQACNSGRRGNSGTYSC